MSKKYFVVSDIHSFCKELIASLDEMLFDICNEEHILIVCGDVFDRGDETLKVYKFLKSIPKERLILIKGNHEDLYLKLLNKNFPDSYDFSNGTVKTFCEISGIDYEELNHYSVYYSNYWNNIEELERKVLEKWNFVKEKVSKSAITKWLKSRQWKNYFELGKFIFVHSFIPCFNNSSKGNYGCDIEEYKKWWSYNHLWRTHSTEKEWYEAMWGCPYKQFDAGLFNKEKKNGKVLVCGHWHSYDFHTHYEKENLYNFDIYKSENLIALDGCTARSGKVNVLVIDEKEINKNE